MTKSGKELDHGATIHNVRLDSQFTMTVNSTPEDPRLSWAAKGLLWYILTREKSWKVYVWQLAKIYAGDRKGNKKDAIQEMLRELRAAGYVNYTKYRDEEGKWCHRYDVYPMPMENFQKMTPHIPKSSTEQKPEDFQKKIPERDLPALDDPAPDDPVLLPSIELPSTDRTKKEVKESKKPIVHNSPPPPTPHLTPSSNSIDSIPFQRKDYSIDLNDPALYEILDMEPQTSKFFRSEILTRWIGKFGPRLVLETIKFFFHIKATQKKPIPKPEAWMEVAFKKKFTEVDKSSRENKEFAENLKKTYRLGRLKINKRYCQDTETGKDYYYYLPPDVFQGALNQLTE